MAVRPVFIPSDDRDALVKVESIEFQWFPGFSVVQKKKSIESLHRAFKTKYPNKKILEVSTKSSIDLGVNLSAFNLQVELENGCKASVESIYQSSKVFENGDTYKDILYKSSREAKKDERLKSSGSLIGFEHKGELWTLEPKTAFYDWIYLNVLNFNSGLSKGLLNYGAFTDIEFNPKKSIACQAYSVALYISLTNKGYIKNNHIPKKDKFLEIIRKYDNELLL